MANPFLFTEDLGSSQVSNSSAGFNPFLTSGGDADELTNTDNPFMSSYTPQANDNSYDVSNAGTNPFAFPVDSNVTSDFFSLGNQDVTCEQTEINYDDIFSSQSQMPPSSGIDIFNNADVPSDVQPPVKPTQFIQDDFLTSNSDANDIFGQSLQESNATEDLDNEKGPPRRPPPPRPGPPKETKDLILSVTGAMEATSSHLLDRLQATRTPSPTPMRDLHSPSPTHFGDLLEVDEPMAPMPNSQLNDMNFLGDDFDFPPASEPMVEKRPSIAETTLTPITPVVSMTEPIQPLTPIPVNPAIAPTAPAPAPAPSIPTAVPPPSMPPGRPAPPSIPERPKLPPQPMRPPLPARVPTPEPPQEIKSPQIEPVLPKDSGFSDMFGDLTPSNAIDIDQVSTTSDVFESVFPDTNISVQNENIFSAESDAFSSIPSHTETVTEPLQTTDAFSAISDETPFSQTQSANVFAEPINATPFSAAISAIKPEEPEMGELDFTMATNQAASTEHPFNIFESAQPVEPAPISAFDSISAVTAGKSPFDVLTSSAPTTDAFDAITGSAQLASTFDSIVSAAPNTADDFDAFTAKFENAGFGEAVTPQAKTGSSDPFDPFTAAFAASNAEELGSGFGADDNFDSFLSLREPPPVPQGTPARVSRGESTESVDDNEFNIFIKPKQADNLGAMVDNGPLPALAPPPKSPSQMNAFQDTSPRFNPFDSTQEIPPAATENIFAQAVSAAEDRTLPRTDSQETPPTPLFDEDVSQPLENFPRIEYDGPGWEMQLRQPNKKKITGQRFWKKIFIKLVVQAENPILQLFNGKDDKDPFQELPLQPCYSVSDIAAQQYDQFGKIFTIKLQFIFYKERPGVRPGQVTKAERITNKLSQFAAYAIQGDYQGVKEFGSDLKKLGLPVEHAPQISQLFKIGSQCYEDMKQFSMCVEEALFHLSAHRDRALTYKLEEVQITAVDELYVEQNAYGGVEKQIARVRLFFLGFLSGMPDVELGVNDLVRQGKEVVGRHDIIPVVTEEWIRLENVEFHSCVQLDEYERTRTIKFKPPDACYLELMRFRIRPPRNRELPLQLKTTICVTGNKVEIHGDILVPGFTSRKLGQIPCEDVMVRIPIPECWIYQFRVEKHFRYGSVKSAHRRTGKVKGIERFLGAIDNMEPSLMEVTSGQAKYEHQHRAIVWRMPRLPKEGQGAYTTHNLVVRLQLTSYDQIPEQLAKYCYLEFTMPATTVSHTTVRSVSIANSDSDTPPEKYVRQLSRHEYRCVSGLAIWYLTQT